MQFFEDYIRPVLVENCYECHSGTTDPPAGDLRLDSRDGIRAGGELGPAVVPNDTSESLILSALRYETLEMPPDARLDDEIIERFQQWIEMGAPDPRNDDPQPKPEPEPQPKPEPEPQPKPIPKPEPPPEPQPKSAGRSARSGSR